MAQEEKKNLIGKQVCEQTWTENGGDSALEFLNGSNGSAGACTMLKHASASEPLPASATPAHGHPHSRSSCLVVQIRCVN
jgi:hypothetical protein